MSRGAGSSFGVSRVDGEIHPEDLRHPCSRPEVELSPQTAQAVKRRQTAKVLYRALGCAGFARVDLFLTPWARLFSTR